MEWRFLGLDRSQIRLRSQLDLATASSCGTEPPPSGERVTAQHFKFALERVLRPEMASPAQNFFGTIAVARDVIDGKTTSLSGVSAAGDFQADEIVVAALDGLLRQRHSARPCDVLVVR